MDTSTPDDAQLHYAPRTPMRRRRRTHLALSTMAIVVALCVVWLRHGTTIRAWCGRQWLLHQCRHFREPLDRVVYEEYPGKASAQLGASDGYQVGKTYGSFKEGVALRVPREWAALAATLRSSVRPRGATLYFGELVSPGGNRRIVAVQRSPTSLVPLFQPGTDLEVIVLHPNRLTGNVALVDTEEPAK